jgi:hypothetical protein
MTLKTVRFLRLFFVALASAMAHLLELLNKINLPRDEYLTVQQIYRGWALLGIVVAGALFSTLALTIMSRHQPQAFTYALIAFLCVIGAQVVFRTYTWPTNQTTSNWAQQLAITASAMGILARCGRRSESDRIDYGDSRRPHRQRSSSVMKEQSGYFSLHSQISAV